MHLIQLHSGTFHSGTNVQYNRPISYSPSMAAVLLYFCHADQIHWAECLQYCKHCVSILQFCATRLDTSDTTCDTVSPPLLYSHCEKSSLLKEQHFSCHTIVSDLIIFLHLHALRIACCQVERYLHKYSCYFSAQSVIYKFSRLLNSLSSELTQPGAVNAECRLWQRRECDCWIVIKHLP